MKTCSKCKQSKNESEFYFRKSRASHVVSMCKECHSSYMKDKRKEVIEQLDKYKSDQRCQKCGDNRPYVLEFHHQDPSTKEYTIGRRIRASFEALLPEIQKCIVLCSNCHKEFHYKSSHFGISLDEYLS